MQGAKFICNWCNKLFKTENGQQKHVRVTCKVRINYHAQSAFIHRDEEEGDGSEDKMIEDTTNDLMADRFGQIDEEGEEGARSHEGEIVTLVPGHGQELGASVSGVFSHKRGGDRMNGESSRKRGKFENGERLVTLRPEDFEQESGGSDQIDEGASKEKVGSVTSRKAAVKRILQTDTEQKEFLNNFFSKKSYVTKADRRYISQETGIPMDQIQNWFNNRRRDVRQKQKGACNEECARLKDVTEMLIERIEFMEKDFNEKIAIMEENYGRQQDNMKSLWSTMKEMMIVNNRHRYATWRWSAKTAEMLKDVASPLSDLPDLE